MRVTAARALISRSGRPRPELAFVRVHSRTAALALLVLFFLVAKGPGQQPTGEQTSRIDGMVRSHAGVSMSGATVQLERHGQISQKTQTAPDGTFHFSALAPGDYTVVAEKDGHKSLPSPVDISATKHGNLDLILADFSARARHPIQLRPRRWSLRMLRISPSPR